MQVNRLFLPKVIETKNINVSPRNVFYQSDFFEKNENSNNISFKAGKEKVYTQIMNNQGSLAKLGVLAASVFAAIKGADLAGFTLDVFTELQKRVNSENNNETVVDESTVNESIVDESIVDESENVSLAAEVVNRIENKIDENNNINQDIERISLPPRRRGNAPFAEKQLRTIVENLKNLPIPTYNKLIQCSSQFIPKGQHVANGIVYDNKIILIKLVEDLNNSENNEENIINLIEKYEEYKTLNNVVENNENIDNQIDNTIENDLELDNTDNASNNPVNLTYDFSGAPIGIHANLNNLHQKMRHILKSNNIDYKVFRRFPLSNYKLEGLVNKELKEHKYQYIDANNKTTIISILKSPIFEDLFDIHSAMRFMDRFVNLDISDYDSPDEKYDILAERCENALNAFLDALNDTLKNDVKFDIYSTKLNNKNSDEAKDDTKGYAPRITIDTEKLSDIIKDDVQEVLGNAKICVTFAKKVNYNLGERDSNIIATLYDLTQNF